VQRTAVWLLIGFLPRLCSAQQYDDTIARNVRRRANLTVRCAVSSNWWGQLRPTEVVGAMTASAAISFPFLWLRPSDRTARPDVIAAARM
jgi:hypothetical protein